MKGQNRTSLFDNLKLKAWSRASSTTQILPLSLSRNWLTLHS